jgi:hypothetical protein
MKLVKLEEEVNRNNWKPETNTQDTVKFDCT